MATGPYKWEDIARRGCGQTAGGYLRVELAKQTISRSTAAEHDNPGFGSVDFTTGVTTVTTDVITEIPELGFLAEYDLGAFGADNVSIECVNTAFDGSVRIAELFNDNPLFYAWHIRLSYKPAGGSYQYMWHGVINIEDSKIEMDDTADEDTWRVKLSAVDPLLQLEAKPTTFEVFDDVFPHASVSQNLGASNHLYFCWDDGGVSQRTQFDRLDIDLDGTGDWVSFAYNNIYFAKLSTLVQRISNSVGVTGSMNKGAATPHSWEFIYYDGTSDQAVGWDDLSIVSGVYDGSLWYQHWGLFEYNLPSETTFYNDGSLLEMLKQMLLPFGMLARFRVNESTGARYLEVKEIQDYTSNSYSTWYKPAKLTPALRALYGLKIKQDYVDDLVNYSVGDGGIAMKSKFMTANRIPNCFQWRHDPAGAQPGRCDDYTAFLNSLWYHDPTANSGNGAAHSIYKINVKTDGNTGSGFFANSHQFEYDYDHNWAGLLMAKAMAHYWFNGGVPTTGTNSTPLGIYRRYMRRIEFDVPGIQYDEATPAHEIGQYVSYDSKKWWIVGKRYDFIRLRTTFIAETGDW